MAAEFGELHYDRIDLHGPAEQWGRALTRLREQPPERVAGIRVTGIDLLDGLKLLLGEEGWLLLRASGTEPVLRIYAETRTPQAVAALLAAGKELVSASQKTAASAG
jgi:phosphomannomutase